MSSYNSDIGEHVTQIIQKNKKEIKELLHSGTGDSGETFAFETQVEDSFTSEEGNEVAYTLFFSVSYMDEEPHRYQIEDGRYGVVIKCTMEDSAILQTLKDDMFLLSDKYIPYSSSVSQDYPRKEVKISHDLTEEAFKKAFI